MSNVEVMVACLDQNDDSLYREMNLHTDVVLANQCDEYSYKEYVEQDGSVVKLISTADRGVGKNRNKALMNAKGKYLLCSDQDMIYIDGYEKIVEDAFESYPEADIIFFNLVYLNRFTPGRKATEKFKRVHLWNSMRYGTARMAVKKSSIEKACLSFSTLYGGGAKYSCGEDSLFIREAFRKRLNIYTSPSVIAQVKQEKSTWFQGYTKRYFVDNGIFMANAFPVLKNLLVYHFAYRNRNLTPEYNFFDIVRMIRQGHKEFREYK